MVGQQVQLLTVPSPVGRAPDEPHNVLPVHQVQSLDVAQVAVARDALTLQRALPAAVSGELLVVRQEDGPEVSRAAPANNPL